MRLLICAVSSLLFHSIFFGNSEIKLETPSLVISNKKQTIDLQIRNHVIRKKVTPPVIKPSAQKPPLEKKIRKKEVRKETVKKETVKKEITKREKIKKTPLPILKKISKKEKEQVAPTPIQKIEKKEVKEEDISFNASKQAYVSRQVIKPRLVNRAEYQSNPPPEYPKSARRRRQEGTVTLLVDLDSKGRVSKIQIKNSSGFSTLDKAAKKSVAKWRFSPATINNKHVSSKVIVPVLFKLNN